MRLRATSTHLAYRGTRSAATTTRSTRHSPGRVRKTVRLKPDATSAEVKPARSSIAATVTVSRRDRYVISICLAVLTTPSWAYLIHLSRHPSSELEYARMMAAMGMAVDRPWTAVDALLTF